MEECTHDAIVLDPSLLGTLVLCQECGLRKVITHDAFNERPAGTDAATWAREQLGVK
jgi:hypothetical protein